MSDNTKIVCPECKKEIQLGFVARVPDSQRITVRLVSDSSKYITADAIGDLITNQSKLLKEIARSLGTPVAVFVENMTAKDHEVEIEFLVVSVPPKTKRRRKSQGEP